MSISKLYALLDIPAEEREEFIQEHDVEDMTTRELQAEIKKRKEAEDKQLDAEEKLTNMTTEYNSTKIELQQAKNKKPEREIK